MGSSSPNWSASPAWQFALGKKSGLFSVERFLRQIGKTLDKDKQSVVLDKIKDLALAEAALMTHRRVQDVRRRGFQAVAVIQLRRPADDRSPAAPVFTSTRRCSMTPTDHPYIQHLMKLACASNARIAIPDAQFDARFLEAACIVDGQGWLKVVLPGSRRGDRGIGATSTGSTSAASRSSTPTSAASSTRSARNTPLFAPKRS